MMQRRLVSALAIALFGLAMLGSDRTLASDILVQQPWARASIGAAKAGAAYLTVINQGGESDHLIAVEAAVAKRVELHAHLVEQGVMKMRQVEVVEVAPGEPVILKPGGLHVMFMGLKAPLVEGARFPLTLVFERAGRIETEVLVLQPTAMGQGS